MSRCRKPCAMTSRSCNARWREVVIRFAILLREEVELSAASFRLLNSPQLVLAPVGIRAVQERLQALGGEFGRKAGAAYLLTAPVTEAFLGAGLEGRARQNNWNKV